MDWSASLSVFKIAVQLDDETVDKWLINAKPGYRYIFNTTFKKVKKFYLNFDSLATVADEIFLKDDLHNFRNMEQLFNDPQDFFQNIATFHHYIQTDSLRKSS